MNPYLSLLFPVFLFAITIRNVWPQKMGLKGFAVLYALMVCAALKQGFSRVQFPSPV